MALPGIHLRYDKNELIEAVEQMEGFRHIDISNRHDLNELINFIISDLEMRNVTVSNCDVQEDSVLFDFYCDVDAEIRKFRDEVKQFQDYIDQVKV